jgi:hypothetical protein
MVSVTAIEILPLCLPLHSPPAPARSASSSPNARSVSECYQSKYSCEKNAYTTGAGNSTLEGQVQQLNGDLEGMEKNGAPFRGFGRFTHGYGFY